MTSTVATKADRSAKPKRERDRRVKAEIEGIAPQTKFTPELGERVCTLIRAGNYVHTAAASVGISRETLYVWLRKGAQAKSGCLHQWVLDIEKATAEGEIRDLGKIDRASDEQWQAAAWKLERRYPDRYGRKTRVEGTLGIQPLPMVDPEKLTLDEARQLRWLLDKARPEIPELPTAEHGPLELVAGTSDSNGTG